MKEEGNSNNIYDLLLHVGILLFFVGMVLLLSSAFTLQAAHELKTEIKWAEIGVRVGVGILVTVTLPCMLWIFWSTLIRPIVTGNWGDWDDD